MKRLGEYRDLEFVGRGEWTGVYRGRHRESGREYALKVFGPLEPSRREALERAVARASLGHPQILKTHGLEADPANGCCFLIMEYAAHGSLRQRLSHGALEIGTALEMALQMARGLEAAHARGICHLNLKPENILFIERERVTLADFGLAACKEEPSLDEAVRGAPGYLAPEQLEGSPGPASDVYALGAVLFEMLTGQALPARPVDEQTPARVDARMRLKEAGLENCADLASLLERFLAPSMEDRPAHGGQAAALLELLAAGRGPAAFNRTMDLGNRCEVCQKPIPLSRSLCPICAERAGQYPADEVTAPVAGQGASARGASRARSYGIGLMMILLLGAGVFSWQGGAAWRMAEQPKAVEAPAEVRHAALPRGVAIMGAAAGDEQVRRREENAAKDSGTPKVAQASARRQPSEKPDGLRPSVREALYTSAAKAGSLGKAVRAELERSPQTLGARRNLALLLMQKGSYEKAADLLKGILKENPNDKEARSTLEMIAMLSGRG